MKLVEILAKKLDVWPTGAAIAVQDGDAQKTVKFGSEHANPSIALMGLKDVWQAIDWKYTYQSDFDHSVLASDWKTAIVTKAQWQAERDRQKGGEWKRHRGNSQPADEGSWVEVKLRCGDIQQGLANAFLWRHADCDVAANIMKFRVISKPQAEEVEVNVFVGKDVKIEYAYAQEGVEPEHLEWKTMGTAKIDSICDLGSTEAKTDQIDGPIRWRDTVNELDAYIEEFTRERDSLINRLALEGFALIPAMTPVMGVADVDMGDWRNWKVGDIVSIKDDVDVDDGEYSVLEIEHSEYEGDMPIKIEQGWPDMDCAKIEFVSRP